MKKRVHAKREKDILESSVGTVAAVDDDDISEIDTDLEEAV